MEFIRDAGFGIFPVLLFGLVGLALAIRHAMAPARERFVLVAGFVIATVLLGALGAVVGVQTSAAGYSFGTPPLHLFLIGLRESLNNMVAALVLATVQTLIATYGAHRSVRLAQPARG